MPNTRPFWLLLLAGATATWAPAQITFAPAVQYTLPQSGGYQLCIVAADFNGDGRPDVAVCIGNGSAGIGVFMNKGDGTLLPPVVYGVGSGSTNGLAAIDLNSDGHPDLVAISGSGLNVLLNRGDGTFNPAVTTALPGAAFSLVSGDFNGDGRKDVAISYGFSTPAENAVYLNQGNGTLAFASSFTAPPDPSFCCGISILADAADVNGDGVDDIITTEENNGFSILLGQRNGSMGAPTAYPGFSYAVYHFADINGDGKPDVVAKQQYAAFSYMLNYGGGTFGPPTGVDPSNYSYGMSIAIADFNNDGSNDVVGGPWGDSRTLYCFSNSGSATFGAPATQYGFETYGNGAFAIAIADFDGDGLLDLAYYDGSFRVQVLRNTTKVLKPTTSLTGVFPNNGGNAGTVSGIEIIGSGFPSSIILKLTGPGGSIVATNVQVSSAGDLITASFNLVGATPGTYSVVVMKPDGTVLATEPAAFTVASGGAAAIRADIVGLSVLKGGLAETYYVMATNTGNIDAPWTTLWLSFPSYIGWTAGLPSEAISFEQIGTLAVLGIDLITVPAGETITLPIMLTAPTAFSYAHQPIALQVWQGQ